jgi:predicted esterase YcpF (UPF0227 family)
MTNIIFIHGLESSGHGFKGQLLRKIFPEMLTPDFKTYTPELSYQALLSERMTQLKSILENKNQWILIGSSFGGLMGALYTCKYPEKVLHLILLAPALLTPELNPNEFDPISVQVTVFHGKNDSVIPLKLTRKRAEDLFLNLEYHAVDDDHMLHNTVQNIDWLSLVQNHL